MLCDDAPLSVCSLTRQLALPHSCMNMKLPMIPLLGLALLFAAPAVAQEEKEAKSTQGVETQKTTAGTIEKASGDGVGNTAQDVAAETKKAGKAAKMSPEERKCTREVANEMGKYRERQAQLKRAHKIGKEKNNQELLDKVAELRPRMEAQHEKEMKRLNDTYGAEMVKMANQAIVTSHKRGGAKDDAMRKKGTGKVGSEKERIEDKGRKSGKKRKLDKDTGEEKKDS